MSQPDEEPIDEKSWAAGWRRELKEAVDAELEAKRIPIGEEVLIQEIWVKPRRANPLHDYRVVI